MQLQTGDAMRPETPRAAHGQLPCRRLSFKVDEQRFSGTMSPQCISQDRRQWSSKKSFWPTCAMSLPPCICACVCSFASFRVVENAAKLAAALAGAVTAIATTAAATADDLAAASGTAA